MHRFWLLAVLAAQCPSAAVTAQSPSAAVTAQSPSAAVTAQSPPPETGSALLNRIRQVVSSQLAHTSNYTCVESVAREYWVAVEKRDGLGCGRDLLPHERARFVRDRLRLDVAVSEGSEIYSWHGEAKFSAESAMDLVQSGSTSSGSFVGYLVNIFQNARTQFTYGGEIALNGVPVHTFSYAVPLAGSLYRISDGHGTTVAPFHGTFSATVAENRLVSLEVIADQIAASSNVCSVQTDVTYQEVETAGKPSLIPAFFNLRVVDATHSLSLSRSEYSQCHEFRGESTLRFDLKDASTPTVAKQLAEDRWLPPGVPLHIALTGAVDGETSYEGDPVQGTLLNEVTVPQTGEILPKHAAVLGVLTRLESYDGPPRYGLANIKFSRLTFGSNSFLLEAIPRPDRAGESAMRAIYGSPLPPFAAKALGRGVILINSRRIRLPKNFRGYWITAKPPASSPDVKTP